MDANKFKFEPFTIVLHDDGELVELAHVRPDLTMITTTVNRVREPCLVIDTKHLLMIADAINKSGT